MASRYWVGGTATWDGTAGTKWATTSGGAGGAAVPTAADDVFLDAASGTVTVTLSASSTCRSLDCNGFVGTLSHPAAINMSIGDGTAGAGNRALRFVAGMTYTLGSGTTSILSFVSTSGTVQTVTTGGKTIVPTFNGAGGSWQCTDTITTGSGNITLSQGTFDTNSQTITTNTFVSTGSAVRVFIMGSSSITVTGGGTVWNVTSTNFTVNPGTSTIILTGAANTFSGGGLTWYNLTYSGGGAMRQGNAGNTYNNLTIIGKAVKTDSFQLLGVSGQTINGIFTVTGDSAINRVLVFSNTVGTPLAISAASVSLTNVDFQDITGAGTASWTGTSLGDCGGNSGITFTTPTTQTNTGATGNWSDVTKWTSRVPLPQDTVLINTGSGTITADMPRLGKDVDCTGFGGIIAAAGIGVSLFGSLTLSPSLTSWFVGVTLAGRGTHTVTSGGRTFANTITFQGPGGSYTLQDALITTTSLTIAAGTFTTNNFSITCSTFSAIGAVSVFNAEASTINLTSTSATSILLITNSAIINSGTSNFVIANPTTNSRTIAAPRVFYSLTYIVANSPGSLVIGANHTFTNLIIGPGRILTNTASGTVTIQSTGTFNVNGVNNGYIYLPGTSGNYISAPDSAALSITGDIDIRVRIAMDDWTPSSTTIVLGKWNDAGGVVDQRSYLLRVTTGGNLIANFSTTGANSFTATSTVPTGFSDGSTGWIRVTRAATSGDIKFYTSSDNTNNPSLVTWTQLGSTITALTGNLFDSNQLLELGSYDTGTQVGVSEKFYRALIQNGIAGTVVFEADFTAKPVGANSFTESSTNAATVTINGALAQVGDGRVSLVSSTPGTQATLSKATGVVSCNYLSIQDSNATGGAAWYAGANSIDVSNNTGWIFASATGTPSTSNFFEVFE